MNLPLVQPTRAWNPLSARDWSRAHASHLLRRTGWTALPEEVERAFNDGLTATIERLFPPSLPPLPPPPLLDLLEQDLPDLTARYRAAADGPARRNLARERRERFRVAEQALALQWLHTAAQPTHAAGEKWVHFLSDVYVVSSVKVKNPLHLQAHVDLLRQHALGPAPELTKAISRSPAMVNYLDLRASRRDAPNENFARELFELFVLGEGNYSEADIKAAARAFTGYRLRPDGSVIRARDQFDGSRKTIFGRTARFDGDGVINLAYEQPAAAGFLPRELLRFYVTSDSLPPDYIGPLAAWWRRSGFNLGHLARRIFASQLFYDPAFRGNAIKSPLQFYLGLVQDLGLDVLPLPRPTLNTLRQMGQPLYQPPNVRGWVGGRLWINASTLAARRTLVQMLFSPLDEGRLNADDRAVLTAARAAGSSHYRVDKERLGQFARLPAPDIADRFAEFFIADPALAPRYRQLVHDFLATESAAPRVRLDRVREAIVALLQSPAYQLC